MARTARQGTGSEDLKLLIIALNNSLKKRVDLASKATAELLNNSVFCVSGPVKRLAACLGNTGERAGECVLQNLLPDGWTQSIFPISDTEATARPLVKGKYNQELHLAIGLLRMFDAEANSPVPGTPPQCDFRNSPYNMGLYGSRRRPESVRALVLLHCREHLVEAEPNPGRHVLQCR